MSALTEAFASQNWEAVDRLLDKHFFFYLFTDDDLLDRLFQAAPEEWYERNPRNVMRRAITSAARRPVMLIDDDAIERFSSWVSSQRAPEARDLLVLRQARIRELLAAGRYRDASAAADDALDVIHTAVDMRRFSDVLPVVFLLCGTAKLLAADVLGAISAFTEGVRWATVQTEHPAGRYAREHLALAYTLAERYRQAERLLTMTVHGLDHPGHATFHFQQPGILARALIDAATGSVTADAVPDESPVVVPGHHWWWVPVHARAIAALVNGTQRSAINEIGQLLISERTRSDPESLPGAVLRADLATLHQSLGDLQPAHRTLNRPGLSTAWPGIPLARARQEWLRGHAENAVAMLHEEESATGIPISLQAGRAVLYAEAELAISGTVSDRTIESTAWAVNASKALSTLTLASPELRDQLGPLLDDPIGDIPIRFGAQRRPRLTRREREILEGLVADESIADLAHRFHVSPNTIKTHLRVLYRKLGAHGREEAAWIGRRML
ncbi:hypothetical protein GCM10027568_34390 [Humibacter soli]